MLDGDALYEKCLENRLIELNLSPEEVKRAREKKKWKEDVYLYKHIIASKSWETDITCNPIDSYLRLSIALDGLSRRQQAIQTLEAACSEWPDEAELSLALAKLLFRSDFLSKAFRILNGRIIPAANKVNHFPNDWTEMLD